MESRAVAGNGSKRPRDADTQPSVLGGPEDPWSYHKKTVPADVPVRLLPQFVQLANSEDPKDQLQGTLLIRKLMCVRENPPLDQIVESQVVRCFISFLLRDDFADLQLEAAWAVSNVASGTSAHTQYVIEQGAVPHFIRLLSSPSEAIREQATWALGNIAGDSATCRDHILGQGVMAPLLQCITTPAEDIRVLRYGVWVVTNLCRSKPSPDLDTVCQALPVIVPLLAHDDEEVVSDACWALSYISDGPPARVERVLNTGALSQITAFLSSVHTSQQTAALRIVGNVSAGNEGQRRVLLSCGLLSQLHLPLQHPHRTIRKEACWALSNIITASEHIQAVIEEGLFPAIIQCIGAVESEINKEAVWCVANLSTRGTPEQIRYVVEELNVFETLVQVLALDKPMILKVALSALRSLLQAGSDEKDRRGLAKNPYVQMFTDTYGFSYLENLESHSNNDVSDAAENIVDTFFERVDGTVPAAAQVEQTESGDPEDPWSYHKKTVPADVPVRLLPQFVQLANSEDPKDQLQGTLLIRKLLCVRENPPLDQIVESQVVRCFISFLLRDDFADLQLEAAWAVSNVASGTSAHTQYVIEQGAVPHFIRLLSSPSEAIREQATWALGNIAGDSATCRDHILGQGVMAPLLQCITTPAEDIRVLRYGVWVVTNLCRSKPSPDLDTVCQALPVIVPLLAHDDEEVVSDACWALSYISDGPPARVERVLNTGALSQITAFLSSVHTSQQTAALRIVGNVSAGNEGQRRVLLSCGLLSQLHLPLQHPHRTIRKEACWALSNIITASEHIQAVIEEGLFPAIIQCIGAVESEINKEAVWCVANLSTRGTPEQIRYVVEELNVFETLVQVLALDKPMILKVALNALRSLLQAGSDEKDRRGLAKNPYVQMFTDTYGFSYLENLESHSNNDVSDAAENIVDTFFERVDGTVPAAAQVEQTESGDPEDPWSYHKKTVPADVPVRLLPQFVQLANSEDPKDQLQGTLLIRKLLCVRENPPLDQIVESQVVRCFISFLLRDDFADLQLEAAWAVSNVASGTSAHTQYVIEQGAVPHFIRLLSSPSEAIREQATWALGNIAGDSATCRDHILGQGVMAPLLQCITTPAEAIRVLRYGVWVVTNLCRSKPSPDLDTVCQALPVIVPLLAHDDEEVVSDACWALSYISDGPPARVERVLNTGALSQITAFLSSVHTSQQTAALRIVGNVSAGNEGQRRVLLSCGLLSQLHLPLQHPHRTIRKEACWALSNIITASEHIQAVIEEGLFPAIIQCIGAVESEINKEAVWCVANLSTRGTPEQIRYVVEELNVFETLVQVLALDKPMILKVALNALRSLLQAGSDEKDRRGLAKNPYVQMFTDTYGFSYLENLESHSNNDVSDAAENIVDTFFERVDGTVPAAAQVEQTESGYAFGGTDPSAFAGAD